MKGHVEEFEDGYVENVCYGTLCQVIPPFVFPINFKFQKFSKTPTIYWEKLKTDSKTEVAVACASAASRAREVNLTNFEQRSPPKTYT